MMTTIVGAKAIEMAAKHGLPINKFEDPTEVARFGISADDARAIAAEDPSLIWVEIPSELITIQCNERATVQVVRDLIATSVAYGTTATGAYSEAVAKALLAECESDKETETSHTFRGVDCDGRRWSVTLA